MMAMMYRGMSGLLEDQRFLLIQSTQRKIRRIAKNGAQEGGPKRIKEGGFGATLVLWNTD